MKVLIVGGGIVGLYAALDATLRGAECTIIDAGKIGQGTTAKATGMLHSGARYIVSDPTVAELCFKESKLFKKNFPFAVGSGPGLFVILNNHDQDYLKKFEEGSKQIGLPIHKINRAHALELEPNLGPNVEGAYLTPDVPFHPDDMTLALKRELTKKRCKVLEFTKVIEAKYTAEHWQTTIKDQNGFEYQVAYDVVVNATGSFASKVINIFGGTLKLKFIHGLVITIDREPTNNLVSAVARSVPGDVLVPTSQGLNIGATWQESDNAIPPPVTEQDKQLLIRGAEQILGPFKSYKITNELMGTRTHLGYKELKHAAYDDSRNFIIVDHFILDKQPHLYSALAGKLVLGRLVAERLVNKIFESENISSSTASYRLSAE